MTRQDPADILLEQVPGLGASLPIAACRALVALVPNECRVTAADRLLSSTYRTVTAFRLVSVLLETATVQTRGILGDLASRFVQDRLLPTLHENGATARAEICQLVAETASQFPNVFDRVSFVCRQGIETDDYVAVTRLAVDMSKRLSSRARVFAGELFSAGLDVALVSTGDRSLHCARALLPGLYESQGFPPEFIELVHGRLATLDKFDKSALLLLVHFSVPIYDWLTSDDTRTTWVSLIARVCLDELNVRVAPNRKHALFLLANHRQHLPGYDWDAYIELWGAVTQEQCSDELAQVWPLLYKLTTHFEWLYPLLQYGLCESRMKSDILESLLNSSFPPEFSARFVTDILLPLCGRSSWLRSVRGKTGSIYDRSQRIVQFVSHVHSPECPDTLRRMLIVMLGDAQCDFSACVTPFLEFVADARCDKKWLDDASCALLRSVAVLSHMPAVRCQQHASIAKIISNHAGHDVSIAALGSLLGALDSDAFQTVKLDVARLESVAPSYIEDWLSGSGSHDAVAYSRILSFLQDSRAIFDTVITKCLLCLSEAQSRPYLSHRFQPDRALALLQGSLGSRAMRPVRDFLADERLSDSLSLYLSERQASSADAHSVLKELVEQFPDNSVFIAHRRRCYELARSLVSTSGSEPTLSSLYTVLTSLWCKSSPPDIPELIPWLLRFPDSAVLWECLSLVSPSQGGSPDLIERTIAALATTFDDSLFDIYSVARAVLVYATPEQQSMLIARAVESFNAARPIQARILASMLRVALPAELWLTPGLHGENGAIACALRRVVAFPYKYLIKVVEQLIPLLMSSQEIAASYASEIAELSVTFVASETGFCTALSAQRSHVRMSVLALHEFITDKGLVDALLDVHFRAIAGLYVSPHVKFADSPDSNRFLLHMQAAGLLLGKCSESSSLRIRDTLWNMLETGLCPTLRQAVQCCLVRLIVTSPRVFFEDCVARLESPRGKPGLDASILIVAGLAALEMEDSVLEPHKARVADIFALRCVHNAGVVRVPAQLLLMRLHDQWKQFPSPLSESVAQFIGVLPEFQDLNNRVGPKMFRLRPMHFTTLRGLSELADDTDAAFSATILETTSEAIGSVLTEIRGEDADSDANWAMKEKPQKPIRRKANGKRGCRLPTLSSRMASAVSVFQRKIRPLEAFYADWDINERQRDVLERFYSSAQSGKSSDFVLIASLVERPTNLGGLARTAEIFGVGRFVVNDFNVLKDPLFTSLSVTSHNWLNIEECRVSGLPSLIKQLQGDGYTIVGLEQSDQSVSLESYVFPAKCALLLGIERTGIPADLLSIVDACLEIPQLGVVRSLNVHVSGAISMWQYCQQHCLNKK
ncbi:tRNA/rRNA methyltransferase SpoU type domain-containing protein [Plasmodiophora brassicae]